MTGRFTLWCNSDDDGGPDLVRTDDGVELVEPDAWWAWLDEHRHHDLSLVVENLTGLPFFQATRGAIKFKTGDEIEAACAWSNYRSEYGVHADRTVREREHAGFLAGWAAARGTLDVDSVQR